jgi:hypothetical protein
MTHEKTPDPLIFRKDEKPAPPLQSVEATQVVAEDFFDHRRRYALLAPHHTHHAVFGLILVAIRICYKSSRLVIHFDLIEMQRLSALASVDAAARLEFFRRLFQPTATIAEDV